MTERRTSSGIEIEEIYGPGHLEGWNPAEKLGVPGEPPFTRGPYARMYRERTWTMRQYAGFGTAADTNRRWRALLEAGQTGLSCAFDLPTQMGLDSDHQLAAGEVGRVGVAIDSLADMRALVQGLPLDRVSLSMTINATAPMLLVLYELAAEEQGIDAADLQGTVQNDILKEYVARGTYVFPPKPSLRLVTDTVHYCRDRIPRWNPISISGYHMREAGSTAVQEVAYTFSHAIAYLDAAIASGLDIDDFAPRFSFFWNAHNNLFEEIAKFRAARRIWSEIVMNRYNARDPRSSTLRFHTQTAGSTLTAQQPHNNVVRVSLQALAAVLGGTQSLHTNGYDEAIGLPSAEAALLALRTQQVIALESGVTDTVDPLAGSYFVESLTDEIEKRVLEEIARIDALGGALEAIEQGVIQREIERAAIEDARAIESGERAVVGVNVHTDGTDGHTQIDDELPQAYDELQIASLSDHRNARNQQLVERSLEELGQAAASDTNLLPGMREAFRTGATLGEVTDRLREAFGVYRPSR